MERTQLNNAAYDHALIDWHTTLFARTHYLTGTQEVGTIFLCLVLGWHIPLSNYGKQNMLLLVNSQTL